MHRWKLPITTGDREQALTNLIFSIASAISTLQQISQKLRMVQVFKLFQRTRDSTLEPPVAYSKPGM
jgi:hypothetical protein